MPYVPAASAAVHMLCSAEAARPKLEWPSVDRDQRYKQKQNENILSTMQEGEKQNNSGIALGLSGLSPMLRSHRNVVMDVLGAALHIITPKVRPLALVALSPAERAGMAHSVKAMASLGLTFSLQVSLSYRGVYLYIVSWLSQSVLSGALESHTSSSYFLLSHSTIKLASHITIILTFPPPSHSLFL